MRDLPCPDDVSDASMVLDGGLVNCPSIVAGDTRTTSFPPVDFNLSANHTGAILHDSQAHPISGQRRRFDPCAVIDDLHDNAVIFALKPHLNAPRMSMPHGVADSFLRDAIKMNTCRQVDCIRRPLLLKATFNLKHRLGMGD